MKTEQVVERKVCLRCNSPRPLDRFHFSRKCISGQVNVCKDCKNAAKKLTRQGRIDKIRQRDREYSLRRYATMTTEQRAQKYRTDYASRLRHLDKHHSRIKAEQAIRDGKIPRLPCVRCGATNAQGHHEDYSKPFELMWLCPIHHAERHREIKVEQARAALASDGPHRKEG